MANKSNEYTFQNGIINQMVAPGWQLGSPAGYNRDLALYAEDVIGFVAEDEPLRNHKPLFLLIFS